MFEITITIKGEDSTFKMKDTVYQECTMNSEDPIIKDYIKIAVESSKIIPETIQVRTVMAVQ